MTNLYGSLISLWTAHRFLQWTKWSNSPEEDMGFLITLWVASFSISSFIRNRTAWNVFSIASTTQSGYSSSPISIALLYSSLKALWLNKGTSLIWPGASGIWTLLVDGVNWELIYYLTGCGKFVGRYIPDIHEVLKFRSGKSSYRLFVRVKYLKPGVSIQR